MRHAILFLLAALCLASCGRRADSIIRQAGLFMQEHPGSALLAIPASVIYFMLT